MTRFHRNVNIAAAVLPFVAVLAAIPMLWNDLIGWVSDHRRHHAHADS